MIKKLTLTIFGLFSSSMVVHAQNSSVESTAPGFSAVITLAAVGFIAFMAPRLRQDTNERTIDQES